jgi:hypothetical protein
MTKNLSLARGDDECPYPPFDRPVAKAARQRCGGVRGRAFEAASIARLDFVAQRRAFAVGDGGITRGRRYPGYAYSSYGYSPDYYGGGYGYAAPHYGRGFYAYGGPQIHRHAVAHYHHYSH